VRKIAAGTSWIIEDGPNHHRECPRVVEGDEQDFRAADHGRGCLCYGVPGAFVHGTHVGYYWDTEKVDENMVRVTLRRDYEYDPDEHPALAVGSR